jgi:transposase
MHPGTRLPPSTIDELKALLFETDLPVATISERTNISKAAIYRLKKNLELYGQPYPPELITIGRPRLLNPAQEAEGEYIYKPGYIATGGAN